MSYLKLPTTTQDHAVGFQSVNQAIDNNNALKAHFATKHSVGIDGFSPQYKPTLAVGRHNDILIARTVAEIDVDTSLPTPTLSAVVSGPCLGALQYARLGTGQWQIFFTTPQLFAAVGLMKSSSSVDRKATVYRSTSLTQGPSVIVTTWDVAAAAPDDLPFSLILWTQAA